MKEYLSHEHVSFVDRDINVDPSAISELQKLGFMTTPVTVIGEKVIVGFDQGKLSEALNLEKSEN
ncbi:MAG: glutaredoxin family protein [Acidobacteriota bacterium]|nr:glutaredoxin family protein [Acidobacteriota bacterium]